MLKSSRTFNDFAYFFFGSLLVLLVGCNEQVELNSDLLERDANAVLSALSEKNISAEKRIDKNGITILVDSSQVGKALRILSIAGLPKAPHDSLGSMFPNDGVISTPLEEQARYIHALSQELEYTLSEIDGVVLARVHVVLPEKIAPGEPISPASASVFIKHQTILDPDVIEKRIQRLVAGSIPGLIDNKSKMSVVFVPVQKSEPPVEMKKFGPFWLLPQNYYLKDVVIIVLVMMILLAVSVLLLGMYQKGLFTPKKLNIREFKFPMKK